ncbi:MAG: ABC transporter ATP-binding protein [Candidatus Pelethousia sp.]|nr:ABC transporter ATP-binding protein [Candidatus Pelethousia sp.]
MQGDNIIEIKDLRIVYKTQDGVVEALNGASLSIKRGQTLGLVGETGAGKTTLARGVMRLIPTPPGKVMGGEILFEGQDLLKVAETDMRKIRGAQISMIFQDPMTSLNPVMTVGEQIAEVLRAHGKSNKEAVEGACEILETVGIPKERATEYPHQFSGGMKQRIIIAIALACNPKFLIADEPTTALDVTIQYQVLVMMQQLKEKFNTSMLLITHDLGIVAQNCDYVAIMYAGEVVEYGALREIFKDPKHPYTLGLFGSIPSLSDDVDRLTPIEGMPPDPTRLPTGCKFHPRCKYATEECSKWSSEAYSVGGEHTVRCLRFRPEDN